MTDPTSFLFTVQRPDGTLERVEFADGASWNAADSATIRELIAAGDAADELADTHRVIGRIALRALNAMADDTATSREAAVESNARQTIADVLAGRVGSQTVGDLGAAVGRARTDSAAGRAINRGMEREWPSSARCRSWADL